MRITDAIDAATLRQRFPQPKQSPRPSDLQPQKRVVNTTEVKQSKPRSKLEQSTDALRLSFEHVRRLTTYQPAFGVVFILPLSPISMNSALEWYEKDKLKDQYREYFECLWLEKLLPPCPNEAWRRARVQAICYAKKPNDSDNLMSRIKGSIDQIVRAGYLVDDSPDHLQWDSAPLQIVDTKSPAYVVLIFKEVT